MKPDCQQILTQFASFSVEELSDSEAATLLHHLEECEPCQGQWLLFEKSLTIVTQSGPRDEDVEQHRSQQMWLVCMEHALQNNHKKLATAAQSSAAQMNSEAGESNQEAGVRVLTVPRIGLTLIGGALLMLASPFGAAQAASHSEVRALVPTAAPTIVHARSRIGSKQSPLVDYGTTLNLATFAQGALLAPISAPTKNVRLNHDFYSPSFATNASIC